MFENAPHDPVLARMQFNADLLFILAVADVLDAVDLYDILLQFESFRDLDKINPGKIFIDLDMVYFFYAIPRMGELLGDVSVVGEQEQAGRIAVPTG